jgi:4-amino-4-deoxy-L-arabinose transferase-like glycosyltransferase
MSIIPEAIPGTGSERLHRRDFGLSFRTTLVTLALVAIVILAAILRFANIGAIGQANPYYTAAVKSMLESWHNFFFVAAEPGGSVSVDKPPLGLWLQALSALIFGVNGFAVVLPQILAGILSVALLFHLVRRWFGNTAGLLAALTLAVTPVAIAVERNNTPDATLIFTLLLATWAFIKATETGKLRYLLLGAFLVGIGFNIKMLQAFLPLPAFYALYLFASQQGWWRKLIHLGLATLVLLPVALSWAVIVDLTPADQRPYVGSSSTNSEIELIIGYNGLQRLLGRVNGRGGIFGLPGFPHPTFNNPASIQPSRALSKGAFSSNTLSAHDSPDHILSNDSKLTHSVANALLPNRTTPKERTIPELSNGSRQLNLGRTLIPGISIGGIGGIFGIGQPGVLRLFEAGLAAQVSWLLPFALVLLAAMALSMSWRHPITPLHRGLLLWGGWLVTCVIFFSVAGFFHQYYLAMLGAPLAALVAIGAKYLWQLRATHPLRALFLLIVAVGLTLAFQSYAVVKYYMANGWWVVIPIAFCATGIIVLIATLHRQASVLARASFALIALGILIVPLVWSGLTTAYASSGGAMPQAYGVMRGLPSILIGGSNSSGQRAQHNLQITMRPPLNSGMSRDAAVHVNQTLLDYLQAHTQDTKYLLVVPSSSSGAQYVLATGRPVLYAGGFNGSDPVIDGIKLAQLVTKGDVRYVLWGVGGYSRGGNSIGSYLQNSCIVVDYSSLRPSLSSSISIASKTSTHEARAKKSKQRTVSAPGGQFTLYQCGS